MPNQYEIFSTETAGNTKTSAINTLFGYPNSVTKTDNYRKLIKKYNVSSWAGPVDQRLIDACAEMTPGARLLYYDYSDLKSEQYLIDNNWYAPYE